MDRIPLARAIETLKKLHGSRAPSGTDPWRHVLRENVVYLADDARRDQAMKILEKRVGLEPQQILSAAAEDLLEAARLGIMANQRVDKVRECARIVLEEFDGDLRAVVAGPVAKARKALQKFPGIGAPGADKILMFCRKNPVLALESNGLRVLTRLGFGTVHKNYSTTYRSVQEALAPELKDEYRWLIEAHQLLREHGLKTCKSDPPHCSECPFSDRKKSGGFLCPSKRSSAAG